ncbi:MAG: hypothetical protein K940chlam9_01622 [Chlamydiae bacterium]|nr:hypothetical protein [Chlamydiota bacterium]
MSTELANIPITYKIYSGDDLVSKYFCRPPPVKPEVAQNQAKVQEIFEEGLKSSNSITPKIFNNGRSTDRTIKSYQVTKCEIKQIEKSNYYYKAVVQIVEGNLEAKAAEIAEEKAIQEKFEQGEEIGKYQPKKDEECAIQ